MMISGRAKKALIVGSTLLGAAAMVGGDLTWMSGFSGDSGAEGKGADGAGGDATPKAKPRCRTIAECDSRCGKGDGSSCYYSGQGRLQGANGQPDPAAASVLFSRACKAGTPEGCTMLASLHQQGVGVPKDPAKARTLFQQGCNGGDARACAALEPAPAQPAPTPAPPAPPGAP